MITLTKSVRGSIETMSEGCFNRINEYISKFEVKGNSIQETEKNINNLPSFKSGCFTCLQSKAFAEYFHR